MSEAILLMWAAIATAAAFWGWWESRMWKRIAQSQHQEGITLRGSVALWRSKAVHDSYQSHREEEGSQ